jgi:hypothetical protein
LLRSEPLEPRLENGKRLHYNFKFVEMIRVFMNKKLVKEFLIITFVIMLIFWGVQ